MISPLDIFNHFVGKTWKALVNPEPTVYDVARGEMALGGKAVRILHSVADGAYGGESLVVWDADRECLVYYYFTTASFYTHGTAVVGEDGRIFLVEHIIGEANGVKQNEVYLQMLPGGRMLKQVRTLRLGTWSDWREVIYEEAPGAEVILP